MDMSEFDYNIANGEFSESEIVELTYNEETYKVSAIVSKKYARKEVDGRFTTDLPTFTLTVIIAESQMPTAIPTDEYRYLTVWVGGTAYAVRYVTGTGMISLTLKPSDSASEEDDGNEDNEGSDGDSELA